MKTTIFEDGLDIFVPDEPDRISHPDVIGNARSSVSSRSCSNDRARDCVCMMPSAS